jgi:hypothetical protein
MNPNSIVFALGAYDPEMRAVRHLLHRHGYRTDYANNLERRWVSGTAYTADSLSSSLYSVNRLYGLGAVPMLTGRMVT